jgi:hypothetical protein
LLDILARYASGLLDFDDASPVCGVSKLPVALNTSEWALGFRDSVVPFGIMKELHLQAM